MRRIKHALHMASAAVVAFSSLLSLAIVPAASAATYTCTWTGTAGDDKFSTASNWSGCNSAAPVGSDTNNFVFDNTALSSQDTLNNDITGLHAASITFSGSGTHSFALDGNSITLSGNVSDSTTSGSTIGADLVLAANVAFNVSGNGLSVAGAITGTGNVTKSGVGYISLESANSYTGTFTANAGSVYADDSAVFGPSSNAVSINDTADLALGCGVTAFANSLTLTGASSNPSGQFVTPKFGVNAVCSGGAADEEYGGYTSNDDITLASDITLGSDVTFGTSAHSVTLTGALSGSHNITLVSSYGGQLIINSSSNTSSTANGTYKAAVVTQTLSDDVASDSVKIDGNAVITIDGKRGDTYVLSGGVLKGSGTVGALRINTGATVAPGHSPGCMNTGDLTETGTYQAEIGGTDPCTGYDQLKVTGTVDVTGGTLDVERYNDFKDFKAGQTFTIIDNDSNDAVTGTFSGLAEGATIKLDDGTVLGISYIGGDGNDVVLSVKNVPTTPDTGFAALTTHPITTLAVTVLIAGSIAAIAQRSRKFAVRR